MLSSESSFSLMFGRDGMSVFVFEEDWEDDFEDCPGLERATISMRGVDMVAMRMVCRIGT